MDRLEEIKTIIKIRLRRGEIDSEKFVRWLMDTGLPKEQAEEVLNQLIKEVEDA